jgi:hypothetical protein
MGISLARPVWTEDVIDINRIRVADECEWCVSRAPRGNMRRLSAPQPCAGCEVFL